MVMYTGLDDVARRTGYPVVEVAGWKSRGHGQMSTITTVTCHHDAAGINSSDAAVLGDITRHSKSQYWIDRAGVIFVVAAGLCWHAGAVHDHNRSNDNSIGIEARNNGVGQRWTDAQLDSYIKLCAELIKEFGLDVSDVRSHAEVAYPTGRKVDPQFIKPRLSMTQFRARVAIGNWKPQVQLSPAEVEKKASVGDGKTVWPLEDLPRTGSHTEDSHNAWVKLMADVGYRSTSLGAALQDWLEDLGFYKGLIDGRFGPMSVKALQSFLTMKGLYSGRIDGDRGAMTVRAEIDYLNEQREFYARDPEKTVEETMANLDNDDLNNIKKAIREVLQEKGLVSWPQSATDDVSSESIAGALENIGVLGKREVERDGLMASDLTQISAELLGVRSVLAREFPAEENGS